MGCCHSTSTSPYSDSHDPHARDTTSQIPRAAIAHGSAAPPTRASARSQLPTSSTRPNQRIRAPSPLSRSPKNVSNVIPPWTRSHLESQRRIFFETRVTGHPEIWQTLNEVSILLRQGQIQDAQAILDAANISCPNGRFAKGRSSRRDASGKGKGGGVYDEHGVLYDIPEWVVVDPADLIEDEVVAGEKDIDAGSLEDEVPYEGDDAVGATSLDKGKGRATIPLDEEVDLGEKVKVRARMSTSHADVLVDYHSRLPARVVVEKIEQETSTSKVRLFVRGKSVDPSKPLGESGWSAKDVVNAFVIGEAAT